LITLGMWLCREASAFRNSRLAARLSRVLLSRKSTVSPLESTMRYYKAA